MFGSVVYVSRMCCSRVLVAVWHVFVCSEEGVVVCVCKCLCMHVQESAYMHKKSIGRMKNG